MIASGELEELLCTLLRLLVRVHVMNAVFALQNDAVHKSLGLGVDQNAAGVGGARRFCHENNIVGVAAELGDVALDPGKRSLRIGDAEVAGGDIHSGQRQKAERTQAVLERHNDDVVFSGHPCAVMIGCIAARVAAAMGVHADSKFGILLGAGRPIDVDVEAIFAADVALPACLRRRCGLLDAGPRLCRLSGLPAILTGGRSSKRNAEKGFNLILRCGNGFGKAFDLSAFGGHNGSGGESAA